MTWHDVFVGTVLFQVTDVCKCFLHEDTLRTHWGNLWMKCLDLKNQWDFDKRGEWRIMGGGLMEL